MLSIVQAIIAGISTDLTWVLLLGPTGDGKTTLLHALAGVTLTVVQTLTGRCLEALNPLRDGEREFTISHGVESETFIPNIYEDRANGVVYFDCPGHLDTTVEI